MARAVCDARRGLFTNKPPVGCRTPPTSTWRVWKGWPKYLEARDARSSELLAEINDLLADRFPTNWDREALSEGEIAYLSDKAGALRAELPSPSVESPAES